MKKTDISKDLGIDLLPQNLQEEIFKDIQHALLVRTLEKVYDVLSGERQEILTKYIKEAKEKSEKKRELWTFIHSSVPEFLPILQKEAKSMYALFIKTKEAYEAEI
jgi:glutamine amidotransferase-like uncharacterized protein